MSCVYLIGDCAESVDLRCFCGNQEEIRKLAKKRLKEYCSVNSIISISVDLLENEQVSVWYIGVDNKTHNEVYQIFTLPNFENQLEYK